MINIQNMLTKQQPRQVARCLLLDPSARLLPEQALEHDFYKKDR